MSALKDTLQSDLTVAMKSRDELSAATLRYFRHEGTKGPKSAKLGRRVVYRESDVLAWIDKAFADGQVR